MKNVVKIVSKKKDCRIVVIDTKAIAERELAGFTGEQKMKVFLEQTITGCALFAAMNDVHSKISFSFRLAAKISIFCEIKENWFTIEYTDELNDFTGNISTLLCEKSVLSITIGDWNVELHTGTVEVGMDDMSMVLAHFTVQSDQLPCTFIFAEDCFTRGMSMQPLPFAEKESIGKVDQELRYLSSALSHFTWSKVPHLYRGLGHVAWERSLK